MRRLHDMGASRVVISSSDLGSDDVLVGLGSALYSKSHRMIITIFPVMCIGFLQASFVGEGGW